MSAPADATVRPAGAYRPALVFGDQVFVAGMTPRAGERLLTTGLVGDQVPPGRARELAAVAAERALLAARQAAGEGIELLPLSMTVYVAAIEGYTEFSAVADGASEAILAATGRLPVRAAVGVRGLPGGAPVEVSLILGIVR